MKYTDFYIINDEDELTRQILLSNAKFNIDNLFLDEDSSFSITVITPSQKLSVPFEYDNKSGGHATIANIILSKLYPDYIKEKELDNQDVYFNNRDNIFILTRIDAVMAIIPEDGITMYQYTELKNFLERVKENKKVKEGKEIIYSINDDVFYISSLDEKIDKLKEEIKEKDIPLQYNVNEIDFSNCENDEELLERINKYIDMQKQDRMM